MNEVGVRFENSNSNTTIGVYEYSCSALTSMASRNDRGSVLSMNSDVGRYLQTRRASKSADFIALTGTVRDLMRSMFSDVHAFIQEKEFIMDSTKAWLPVNAASENPSANEKKNQRNRLATFFTKLGRISFSDEEFENAMRSQGQAVEEQQEDVEQTPPKLPPPSSSKQSPSSVTFSPSPSGSGGRKKRSLHHNLEIQPDAEAAAAAEEPVRKSSTPNDKAVTFADSIEDTPAFKRVFSMQTPPSILSKNNVPTSTPTAATSKSKKHIDTPHPSTGRRIGSKNNDDVEEELPAAVSESAAASVMLPPTSSLASSSGVSATGKSKTTSSSTTITAAPPPAVTPATTPNTADMCAFLNTGSYGSFTSNMAAAAMQYAKENGFRARDVGFDVVGHILEHERINSRT